MSGLRAQGLLNGLYLYAREGVGMAIRLGGVLLLTRIIGPAEYGIYAGSVAFVFVLTLIAQMSAEVYLVREVDDASTERDDEVFSFVLVSSVVVVVAALVASELVGRAAGVPVGVLQLLLISVPLSALWAPAQARLERTFRFRRLAGLELAGDVVLYVVALPLAAAGWGALAAATGFIVWQGYLLVGSFVLAGYRPRWRWSPRTNRDLVRFGAGLTMAGWLSKAAHLVNPLVVGSIGGAAAVGVVALALRLVETLSFVLRVTRRLLLAGLARLRRDPIRLGAALSEAMGLQTLAMGVALGGFGLVAAEVVPLVFGDEWTQVTEVLPWISTGALLLATSQALVHALTILGRTGVLARIELARLVVLAVAAAPLVRAFGPSGYGVAVLVALAPVVELHFLLRKLVQVSYRPVALWTVGLTPAFFGPFVAPAARWLLVLPGLAVAVTPEGRRQLSSVWATVRSGTVTAERRSEDAARAECGDRVHRQEDRRGRWVNASR